MGVDGQPSAPAADQAAPIFIVGCPRSGTTLLRDLLRSHPRLSFPHESSFIPALYLSHGDPRDEAQALRIAADLLSTWKIARWNLKLRPADLKHHRSFAGLVTQLYETWAAEEGKVRWGDKSPTYILELETVLEVFPHAQVINVVRDGRDVALSLLRMEWGPSNLYVAARMWQQSVRAARWWTGRLPESTFLNVQYERLLANPEYEMRRVCDFLGEDFDPAVTAPSRITSAADVPVDQSTGRATGIRRFVIDPANAGKWRTTMGEQDRAVFEAVAAEDLRLAGYPLTTVPRRLPLFKQAWWRASNAGYYVRFRLVGTNRGPRAQTAAVLLRARLTARLRNLPGSDDPTLVDPPMSDSAA